MSRFRMHLLIAAAWIFALEAIAFEPAGVPRDGVLLLHNGGILRGQITRAGDRYLVILGDRAEVRVPVESVEFQCLTMDEVYERKRSRLAPNDAPGHLDLAEWCLQQKLLSHAADELLTAFALQPAHPRLQGLERRLQLAVEQPATTGPTTAPQILPVGLVDLEKTSRSLPPGVLEDFTSLVQPLLLNRCGANSCHGSASDSEFRLVRPMWTKTITRRFTQRNLHAVMQQIHPGDVESSPLLQIPSGSHGGVETGVFGPREKEQFDLLAKWVRKAADVPTSAPPQIADQPAASGLLQASFVQPVELPVLAAKGDMPESGVARSRGPASAAVESPQAFAPRDPFDAEIFNRREHQTTPPK